jgi:uncharacterized protein (DUF2141 family)
MRISTIIVLFFFSIPIFANKTENDTVAEKGRINIFITNVRSKQSGKLLVYLYSKESWNKPEKALKKSVITVADTSGYEITFTNVKYPSDYGIQVVHDTDGNGKLTMGWFPPGPREGAGVSNYIPKGIPKFFKAKFEYNGDLYEVAIKLTYPGK